MKRIVPILIVVLIIAVALTVSVKPLVRSAAQKQLKNVFLGAEVLIDDCTISPLHQISLYDIKIKKEGIYQIKLKKAAVQYNPLSILKRNILKVVLTNAVIDVDMPKKSITQLNRHLNLGERGKFSIMTSEAHDFQLDINSKDVDLKAQVSARASPEDQLIKFISLKMDSLGGYGLSAANISINADEGRKPGKFSVEEIEYDKVKITNIKGAVWFDKNLVSSWSFSSDIFNGQIAGGVTLYFDMTPQYHAGLKFINLDPEKLVNDYELGEKFQLTGALSGHINFKGSGADINILNGDFSMSNAGGVLVINDTRFLENIARRSDQPLEILVESFKNYHYNSGAIKLSLKEDNLILDMALDGETGKRDLNITLHNFKLKKEGL